MRESTSGPTPLVSCVIPVCDGERFLGEAIESVLAQDGCRAQVIVVDDGSTDGSAAVARAFGAPVQYVHKENGGPASALCVGFPLARGDFVGQLDADDRWSPDKVATQLAAFTARPDLEISLAHTQNFWEEEVAEEEARQRGHRRAQPIPGYTFGTMLARREVFESVGLPDPARQHGYAAEWFLRVRDRGLSVEVLPDVLLMRRLHRRNRSRKLAAPNRESFLELIKQRLDRSRSTPVPTPEPRDD